MKKAMFFFGLILVALVSGCDFSAVQTESASDPLRFDIRALGSETGNASLKITGNSRALYKLSPSTYLFTPTKFVIRLATIAVNYSGEGGGLQELFNKENDSDCIALDLAKGESLSDFSRVTGEYKPNPVTSIFIAYLPSIEYSYTDNNGIEHNGTLVLPLNTASSGYNHEIGTKRGRIVSQTALEEVEFGWGDSSFVLPEDPAKRVITLLFDLERLLKDDSNPQDGIIDSLAHNGQKMLPIVPGMMQDEYLFRRSGAAGTDYPHKISILYTANGEPVCLKLFIDHYEDLDAYVPELSVMRWEGNFKKDSSWKRNADGTITLMFTHGGNLTNLPQADQSGVPLGDSFYDMKYVRTTFQAPLP